MTALLELRQVTKQFGGLRAINNVSLTVKAGERLGIAGPNGSGKSTLFNVITRNPFGATSGEVLLEGARIDTLPAHAIAARGLLRTFQQDVAFADLNATETLSLAARFGTQQSRPERDAAVAEQLELTGFDRERARLPTTALSVYERKQLMIASALVMQPKILLLDEPASGLTGPEIAQLDALLQRINASGVTVVLIEHVLSLLMSVAERLIVLNEGAVLAEGEPHAVCRQPDVISAYLGGRSA